MEIQLLMEGTWFWLCSKGLCHLMKSRKENDWEKGSFESHQLALSVSGETSFVWT